MKTAPAIAFVVLVTSVFFIDFCDLVYQCGCTHLWAGAATRCNIHQHHAGAKHCPWCSVGTSGALGVYAGIVVPQILLCRFPRRWPRSRRFVVALAAFPVIGGAIAVAMGLAMGYWS